MHSSHPRALVFALCALTLWAGRAAADPIDEAYYRTYYIITLGNGTESSISSHQQSLLQDVGGVMPKNLKVGFSIAGWFMLFTQDHYMDYIYDPGHGAGLDGPVALMHSLDVKTGAMFNGMPWGDASANQSLDSLHNYLEIYNGGELLQVDRNGHFRDSSLPQDPTIDEQSGTFAPYLEMQLTLSRNCDMVQDYFHRNNRMVARHLAWYREEHPDLIVFASTSSEFAQNYEANHEYSDYSVWSKQEFRDWLGGAGLYEGQGQYADLAAFNTAFSLSFASWDDVEPPTSPNWTGGSYWLKWHEFRLAQGRNMTAAQLASSYDAGWSPDHIYGHQIPETPGSSSHLYRYMATDYTTTFAPEGSNGITTYGAWAGDSARFNAVYANDKNWGIFEYNPLSGSQATNRNALEATWNSHGHIVCPYLWAQGGQPTYEIEGTAFELALRDFVFDHRNDTPSIMDPWEAAPESRDAIWAMSETDDVEAFNDFTGTIFTTGVLTATTNGTDPYLSLELDEGSHDLIADAYDALSFRMYLSSTDATDVGQIVWIDGGTPYTIDFTPVVGWHVYRIHLSPSADWREKNIQTLRLDPTQRSGSTMKLDWVRLHATHAWHFDDPGEVYGVTNFDPGWGVSGGEFTGTASNGDAYFYFSTDRQDGSDADRAFIETRTHKIVRFRMTASAAGNAQIYWRRRDTGFFAYSPILISAGTHTYTIDMTNVADWTDHVTVLRLDPGLPTGGVSQVDYLAVTPKMLPPRPVNTDPTAHSSQPLWAWDEPVQPSATGMTYDFQLARDFDGTQVRISKTGLTDPTYIYDVDVPLDGLFWWRVRACAANGDVSPWCVPVPVFIRKWDFNTVEDMRSINNLTTPTISNGIWRATTTGGDPYFNFHTTGGRGVNADVYTLFKCRIRLTGGTAAATAQFFYMQNFPSGPPGHRAVNLPAIPIDGQWHDIEIDLSSEADWAGYMTNVRLDPVAGGSGTLIELDSAEFLPPGAPTPEHARAHYWRWME